MAPKLKRDAKRRKGAKRVDAQPSEREKLLREMKLSGSNVERYRCFWRDAMAHAKMPSVARNVEIAWQTLERAFDLKDHSISILLDSLNDAETQRRKASCAHVDVVARLLQAQQTRLEMIDAVFYGNVEEATLAAEDRDSRLNGGETALRTINALVNERREKTTSIERSNAFSKLDTFTEDGKNERRTVTAQLRRKLETIWDGLRNVFCDYRKSTEDRRKVYRAIKGKDETDQRTIARQCLRIGLLLDEVAEFRAKIRRYANESAAELGEIARESNHFHTVYRETNEGFIADRGKLKCKVTQLSKEYHRSVENLKRLKLKAEQILACLQMCRKYETQDEKILPTFDGLSVELPRFENDVFALKSAAKDFHSLTNFWRRLGISQLIAAELRSGKDRLLGQRIGLRESVKGRMGGTVDRVCGMPNDGSADR